MAIIIHLPQYFSSMKKSGQDSSKNVLLPTLPKQKERLLSSVSFQSLMHSVLLIKMVLTHLEILLEFSVV